MLVRASREHEYKLNHIGKERSFSRFCIPHLFADFQFLRYILRNFEIVERYLRGDLTFQMEMLQFKFLFINPKFWRSMTD